MSLSLRSDKVRQRLDEGRLRLAPGRLSLTFINASQALQFLHLSLPLSGSLPFHGVRYLFIYSKCSKCRCCWMIKDFMRCSQSSDPEVRHVPCAVLIYSRSPQETFLRKRDRKIICPLNSVYIGLSIIFYRKTILIFILNCEQRNNIALNI